MGFSLNIYFCIILTQVNFPLTSVLFFPSIFLLRYQHPAVLYVPSRCLPPALVSLVFSWDHARHLVRVSFVLGGQSRGQRDVTATTKHNSNKTPC